MTAAVERSGPTPAAPAVDGLSQRSLGIIAVVVAAVGLSAGSTMVKRADTPGAVIAFWRLSIGAALWLSLAAARHRLPSKAAWRTVAPAGLLFGVNLALFFSAVTLTRVANVEFIGTLTPVFVVPAAALLLREHVEPRVLALAALALVGVSLVVLASGRGGGHRWSGDLLTVGAVITWSTYLLFTKRVRGHIDTTAFMSVMTTVAAITVLPVALTAHSLLDAKVVNRHLSISVRGLFHIPTHGWILIVVMAVTSGMVSHGLLAWAQQRVAVSTISMMQVSQPGLATLWAFVVLGETVRALQIVGMIVVVVAVALIAWQATLVSATPTHHDATLDDGAPEDAASRTRAV